MAKFPDGMIAIFHPDHKNLTVDYEMKELVLCKNCKHSFRDDVTQEIDGVETVVAKDILFCNRNGKPFPVKEDAFCSECEKEQ